MYITVTLLLLKTFINQGKKLFFFSFFLSVSKTICKKRKTRENSSIERRKGKSGRDPLNGRSDWSIGKRSAAITRSIHLSFPSSPLWISYQNGNTVGVGTVSSKPEPRSKFGCRWKNVTYSRRKWIYNSGERGGGVKKFLTRRATPFPFSLTKNIGKFSAGFICSEFNVPLLQEPPPPSSFSLCPLLPICGQRGSMVYRERERERESLFGMDSWMNFKQLPRPIGFRRPPI